MSTGSQEKADPKTVTKARRSNVEAVKKTDRKTARTASAKIPMLFTGRGDQILIGQREVVDMAKLIAAARRGLRPKMFYDFARKFKMTEKTLASIINISSRTISNYKEKNKLIEPAQAEHLLKLNALYSFGELVFGNIDEFNSWLRKPFWRSKENEETPMSWLITPGGVDLVMKDLERLAEGYPV